MQSVAALCIVRWACLGPHMDKGRLMNGSPEVEAPSCDWRRSATAASSQFPSTWIRTRMRGSSAMKGEGSVGLRPAVLSVPACIHKKSSE